MIETLSRTLPLAIRGLGVFRRLAFAWVLGVLGNVPGSVDAGGTGDSNIGDTVASNQGVSIENGGAAAGVDPSSEPQMLPEGIQKASSESDGRGESAKVSSDAATPTGVIKSSKRVTPAVQDLLGRRAESTAWYRTGAGALTIVMGIIVVLYMAIRRWAPSAQAAEFGALRVVARCGLTPKHHLALLQLGRRFVLVGAGPEGMSTLAEVTDVQEVAELLARTSASSRKSDKRFDEDLMDEMAEYQSPSLSDLRPASFATGGSPLKSLLRRLKAVRS